MSLHNFVSQVQQDIVFDPKFTGIKATYIRRTENKEGELIENKCAGLYVSPYRLRYGTNLENVNRTISAPFSRAILPNLPFLTKIMRLNPQIADISLDAFLKNLYRSG